MGDRTAVRSGVRHLRLVRCLGELSVSTGIQTADSFSRAILACVGPSDRKRHPHDSCSLLVHDAHGAELAMAKKCRRVEATSLIPTGWWTNMVLMRSAIFCCARCHSVRMEIFPGPR